jgi:hypothetical protein
MTQQEGAQHLQAASKELGLAAKKAETMRQNNQEMYTLVGSLITAFEVAQAEIAASDEALYSALQGPDSVSIVRSHIEDAKQSLQEAGVHQGVVPAELFSMARNMNEADKGTEEILRKYVVMSGTTTEQNTALSRVAFRYRSALIATRGVCKVTITDAKNHVRDAKREIRSQLKNMES